MGSTSRWMQITQFLHETEAGWCKADTTHADLSPSQPRQHVAAHVPVPRLRLPVCLAQLRACLQHFPLLAYLIATTGCFLVPLRRIPIPVSEPWVTLLH